MAVTATDARLAGLWDAITALEGAGMSELADELRDRIRDFETTEVVRPARASPKEPKRAPDLVVHLPGPPRGWGRTGHTIIKPKDPLKPAFVSVYTDAETRSYQAMLRYAAEAAMAGRPLYGGALRIRINALFEVPASTSKKARAEMLSGVIRPTKKPDFDNLAKMVDAFKGVIWTDDVQIVDGRVVKAYAEKPSWEMEVYALRLRPALL